MKAVVLGKQLLADYAAVVGGDVGGILHRIQEGITGCLVKSAEQCAIRIIDLLANPWQARIFAKRRHEAVHSNFLSITNLHNHPLFFHALAYAGSNEAAVP